MLNNFEPLEIEKWSVKAFCRYKDDLKVPSAIKKLMI